MLTSRFVREYLRFMSARDFATLRPLLERMLAATDAAVRETGAVHVTLAALDEDEAGEIAASCLAGDDARAKERQRSTEPT